MSEDNSPIKGHIDKFSEFSTDEESVARENLSCSTKKTTKLAILGTDEIFYPTIKFNVAKKQDLPDDCLVIMPEKVELGNGVGGSEKDEIYEKNIFPETIVLPDANIIPEKIEIKTTVDLSPKLETENDEKILEENQAILADTINQTKEPRRRRRIFGSICSGFGTIAVTAIAIIAIALVGMRLAGFRTFTVMSGSMTPDYPVGSLIYVKPVDYKSLKVGDVISYVANDDKTVVTHRIAEIEKDKDNADVLRFKTKGDANSTADAKLVHYKNVLGTPIIVIPNIGYFAHNIQQPPGVYIALVAGTLLLAWAFLPGTLEERRKTASRSVIIE